MPQKIIKGFLLFLCLISKITFGSANHLTELKSKFPYGLLSDDYGILSVDDLAMNACGVEPKKFNPKNHNHDPYEYWQCFESKSLSFDCSSSGVPDEYEGIMGLVIVRASANNIRHEYIERKLWPIKGCKNFIRDAAALLKGIQYACLSGSFIESEADHSGHQTISWIFERLKTQKGCEGHDCEFTKKYKKNNCPNIKM